MPYQHYLSLIIGFVSDSLSWRSSGALLPPLPANNKKVEMVPSMAPVRIRGRAKGDLSRIHIYELDPTVNPKA
ncbi:hypothetical protein AKJ16_DCAP19370 [Drosera capensis]